MEQQTSRHVTTLGGRQPKYEASAGAITAVNHAELEILDGISMRQLTLAVRGVREPHWHANANELGHCVKGEALVTTVGNHGVLDTFTIGSGEMFFFPSGMLHAIENTGKDEAEFIRAFSHEKPEDFALSVSFDVMSDRVLSNTFQGRVARDPKARAESIDIIALPASSPIEERARHPHASKFAAEDASPAVVSGAGSARTAQASTWPALDGLAKFSVRINDSGMREPHWHPETAEMGYALEGRGRMTILDPDGKVDTYLIEPGDCYFISPAYPLHIENVGSGMLHILIFFNNARPQDIGYRAAAAGYSRLLIAIDIGVPEKDLPELPVDLSDPLIVSRI